jgi:molecular chaperone GrpE
MTEETRNFDDDTLPKGDEEGVYMTLPEFLDGDDEKQRRAPIELDGAMDNLDLAEMIRNAGPARKKKKPEVHATPAVVEAEPAAKKEPEAQSEAPKTVPAEDAAALRSQVEQERANTLRAIADLHNYRRRSEEEQRRTIVNANERLIRELLPIVDDFEMSLTVARESQSYEQLIDGVEAILRKIQDTLGKQGLAAVPALGEAFDPDMHEAVMVEEGSDAPDESVVQELRKGYTLHGRVIRPALVKVAKS